MKNLVSALRSLFKKGQNNLIKIVCLGVGLAMGLVLFSKVFFEFTYDDFYPDKERIYMVKSSYVNNETTSGPHPATSGGVVLGMHNEVAEVEVGTRFINMGYQVFRTSDKKKYGGTFIFADTCLFDVLPRPVIIGDVKTVLSQPMYVMISEKIARNMGGVEVALGRNFEVDMAPGNQFIVGGVFKEMPENTHTHYDVIVSLASIPRFMWDGRENWDGNDMYRGYVKLYPDVDPASLSTPFREMQARHLPLERMKENGTDIYYTLHPLTELHRESPTVKRQALLLALLAGAMIFTAVLNYILIVLSSLISRTKEVAVFKTYGAASKEIMGKMLIETAVHLFISIVLSIFLIFLFREKIQEILRVSVFSLFTIQSLFYLTGICIIIFLVAGLIPGFLYARIPVAAAFRNFKETKKNWKLASLLFQFVATTFLVILLVVIWKQYQFMIHSDTGYEYEKVLYCSTKGLSFEERQRLQQEFSSLSAVEKVSYGTNLPFNYFGGQGVFKLDSDKKLFTTNDLELVDANYLDVFEIPIVKGEGFVEGETIEYACLVNEAFEEIYQNLSGNPDDLAGTEIRLTQYGMVRVQGVFSNFRLGPEVRKDARPGILLYAPKPEENDVLIMKLHQLTSDNIRLVQDRLQQLLPEKELPVYSYKVSMIGMFDDHRLFRDSVLIGGIITLIITLIGLMGYLKDEINRRKSEIAIRKINGGSISDILKLFILDITKIVIPSLFFGGVAAWYAARKWQENFAEKIPLSVQLFLFCIIIVVSIIILVVLLGSYKTAKDNPVNSLRSE